MSEIINRVAMSSLVSVDLEVYYRTEERFLFDLNPFLFQELILKEKDFRQDLKVFDWQQLVGKVVAVKCTADAVIPTWAYMLVASYLSKNDIEFVIGDLSDLENHLFELELSRLDIDIYKDKSVVVKGCSKFPVPLFAYGRFVQKIQPYVKSIMYGEPCSTVPIYKMPK